MKKFYLSSDDQWIGGVCGGIARHFGIDALLVRVLFIIFSEVLFPFYLIIWFFADED